MEPTSPNGIIIQDEDGTNRAATNEEANAWASVFVGGTGDLEDDEILDLFQDFVAAREAALAAQTGE
jgi:hypothetical protein